MAVSADGEVVWWRMRSEVKCVAWGREESEARRTHPYIEAEVGRLSTFTAINLRALAAFD